MKKAFAYFFLLFGLSLFNTPKKTFSMQDIEKSIEALDKQERQDLLYCAATLVGEARSEGVEGMQAVMNVIQNRLKSPVKWWHREKDSVPDDTLAAVCVDAWQFSCWNDGTKPGQKKDPNYERCAFMANEDNLAKNLQDPFFKQAAEIAYKAIKGELEDITKKASHYHNHTVNPAWAKGKKPAIIIGGHKFYNNIE